MAKRNRTVTEFLLKVRETYDKAREQYVELSDRVVRLNNEWEAERRRGWSNQEQATADRERYDRMKKEAKKALADHIDSTNAKFQEILDECDSVFAVYDRATSDKYDIATAEILKSGILRPEEYEALAKDFENNSVMLRLIGNSALQVAEKTNNIHLRAFGNNLANYRFKYREPIETLIGWSQSALREDRNLSDGIAKRYDTEADRLFTMAEGIYITEGE